MTEEQLGELVPVGGGDPIPLIRPVMTHAKKVFKEIRLKTTVAKMAAAGNQIKVEMESAGQKIEELYDRVLVVLASGTIAPALGPDAPMLTAAERADVADTMIARWQRWKDGVP